MKQRWVIHVLLALAPVLAFTQNEGVTCGPRFKSADQALFEKGKSLYKAKRYKESREAFHKLSAKYPSAPDPYFYLGMASVEKDYNPAGIRKYFTKLILLCPNYPDALAHYYKAVVDYTDEEYASAVAELNTYFEITNRTRKAEYEALYEEASNYLYWSQFLDEANRNRVPFAPNVMMGVSSKENEYMPYLSQDGMTMYYLRQVAEDRSATFYKRELVTKSWRLFSSSRRDTSFTSGTEMAAPFNLTDNEGGVTLTADGATMYYSIMRLNNGVANCDIYKTRFVGGKWTSLTSAGANVNGPKTWESQPSVSPDGQYLYFASNRDGGMGGTDIWRCHRLPNGEWSRAENLGPSVNTSGNEKCPFIHADGKTLYFASDGWQGFGGYDMYFINVNDSYLQRPTNIGLPINSEGDEICFGVTSDGTQGYYAGKPADGVVGVGGSDIFFFPLYESARPEPMRYVTVRLLSTDNHPLPGELSIFRKGSGKAEYLADTLSGTVAAMLSMSNDNFLVASAADHFPMVRHIKASQVKKYTSTTLSDIALRPLKKGGVYKISGIQMSGTGLTDDSKTVLDAYITFLQEHPMVHIRIEAVTDNMVRAVHNYMLSQKLRPDRFTTKAGGVADLQFVIIQL